jgi:hypothetical protein
MPGSAVISRTGAPAAVHRFKASRAKEIIGSVLVARLSGQTYHADNTSSWAREIADEIKNKLKGAQGTATRTSSARLAPRDGTVALLGRDGLASADLLPCPFCPCLAEENWSRYKFVVQVFIAEQRGEGVR